MPAILYPKKLDDLVGFKQRVDILLIVRVLAVRMLQGCQRTGRAASSAQHQAQASATGCPCINVGSAAAGIGGMR